MSSRYILPFADVGSGIKPSSGAKLFFFEPDGVTPKDTFSDQLTTPTPNANPVIANSNGVFGDIFISGEYKNTLKDKNDVQIFGGVVVKEVIDSDFLDKLNPATLAAAIADKTLEDGDVLHVEERTTGSGADFVADVVLKSTVTISPSAPASGNIVASTGDTTLAIVIRLGDVIDPKVWGVTTAGQAADTTAMQALYDFLPLGGIVRLTDVFTLTQKLTISTGGIVTIGDSNKLNSTLSGLTLDAASSDDELLDIQIDAVKFQSVTLSGKGKAVSGSQIFTTARTDNVADIDLVFDNVILNDVETIGTLTGRGILITNNSVLTQWINGIKLNWPSTLIEGANDDQKQSTGFRSIQMTNSRVHAGSASYIFFNVETNKEFIRGVQISNNYIDTDCGLWRGSLREASITGNVLFNTNTSPFLVQTGFSIQETTITGNTFLGMPDDGAGNTRSYPNFLATEFAKDVTISNNMIGDCDQDTFAFTTTSTQGINISGNIFTNMLTGHRDPTVRALVKMTVSGIVDVSITDNIIKTSSTADAAVVAGDALVTSPGTAANYIIRGNKYSNAWKMGTVTPTAAARKDIAQQIYDGDGTAEFVVDVDFFPSRCIVSAITGANAGEMRMQLFGTTTGDTEVELRNGSIAFKGIYNTSGARYFMEAIP